MVELDVGQTSVQNNPDDVEEVETDTMLFSKHVKSKVIKRKAKIVEMLERYPPVITYHIF